MGIIIIYTCTTGCTYDTMLYTLLLVLFLFIMTCTLYTSQDKMELVLVNLI